MNRASRIQFSSTEQLQAALAPIWDVEITQSESGPIETSLWSTRAGDCLIYGSTSSLALVCSGQRSTEYWTITPVTRRCAGGRFRGQRLDDGDLLLLDPGGEVFQQVAAGHRQHAISIPVKLAERIAQAEYHNESQSLLRQWCVNSNPRVSARLEKTLWDILSGGLEMAAQVGPTELAAQVIALTQAGAAPKRVRSSLAHRRRIVSRAEELIRSRLDRPPSVTELCEATHASRRLLFYAFKELLGRSPAAHAKILRLYAARRRILAGADRRCIQQVALDLGFWHPGQFAIDYSRLFGEQPSQSRLRFAGGFTSDRKTRHRAGSIRRPTVTVPADD